MDSLHYVTIGNPVSKAVINTTASMFRSKPIPAKITEPAVETAAMVMSKGLPPLWQLAGRYYNFMRLAGLSGATAVVLGAIGSHKVDKVDNKAIFDTANRFHFFHSLALMGMPMAKRPLISGVLMISGTVMFSGALYYRAFTGERRFANMAPVGGMCLILAWLSLII